jgi:hypothetical protein
LAAFTPESYALNTGISVDSIHATFDVDPADWHGAVRRSYAWQFEECLGRREARAMPELLDTTLAFALRSRRVLPPLLERDMYPLSRTVTGILIARVTSEQERYSPLDVVVESTVMSAIMGIHHLASTTAMLSDTELYTPRFSSLIASTRNLTDKTLEVALTAQERANRFTA